MRVPAVSFAKRIAVAVAVGLLACGLALPCVPAFAEGEDAPSALLASSLMDGSASVVREDVALAAPEDDAAPEPVIGSFTVDGLTFAVTEGSNVQLVGVSPDWQQATGLQVGEGSSQLATLASEAEGSDADSSALLLPETVAYSGVDYSVTSIGAYAFYLSGVTSVELPASIVEVDDRAFRSSDVASVEVTEGNPSYSSFDGALYDADTLSLLLIPEGKQGTVLLPKTAESAPPSVFSHCSLVTQVSVEEGSAAFASENGLLYDASLETLLRVPAGATDITIREGCTTIAAGAMEACASLATINAPASVTTISPYLFEQQPETVMSPVAVAATEDDGDGDSADEGKPAEAAPQLSTMVALSLVDDGLPIINPSTISVSLSGSEGPSLVFWQARGFKTTLSDEADNGELSETILSAVETRSSMSSGRSFTVKSDSYTLRLSRGGKGKVFRDVTTAESFTIVEGKIYEDYRYDDHGMRDNDGFIWDPTYEGGVGMDANEAIIGWWDKGQEWNYAITAAKGQGYKITSWKTSAGQVISSSDSQNGKWVLQPGLTYTAIWSKKPSYQITLDPNGGTGYKYLYYWPDMGYTGDSPTTDVIDAGKTKYAGKPTAPKGKVFDGYWSDPDPGEGDCYIDKDGKYTSKLPTKINSNEIWYAHYADSTSTVSFDSNDGKYGTSTSTSRTVTATYGSDMPGGANVPIPEKTGWNFAGYYDGKGKDAKQYYKPASGNTAESACKWDKTNSSVTLYARWTRSVDLNRQDGSGGSTTATNTYGIGYSSVDVPSAPSAGWTFLGYCDYDPSSDPDGYVYQFIKSDGTSTGRTDSSSTRKELYAWWVKDVTLNKYASSAKEPTLSKATSLCALRGAPLGYACTTPKLSSESDYEAEVRAKFPDPSSLGASGWAPTWSNAQGWAFDGYWSSGSSTSATQYIDKGGNGVIACPDDMPSTIYAQWARPVTLNKQGGSGGSESGAQVYVNGQTVSYPYRAVAPPTTPPGEGGWEFLGYCNYDPSKSPAGSVYQLIKSDGSPTGRAYSATTLYAWWVKEVTLNEGHDDAVWGTGAKKTINALLGAPLGYVCTTTAGTESEVRAKFPNPSGLGASGWAPTRTGYVFGGYYDSSTGSTRYITASGGRGDAVSKSLGSTIYAKWYATWKFDLNGGHARLGVWTHNDDSEEAYQNLNQYKDITGDVTICEVGAGSDLAIYSPQGLNKGIGFINQAIYAGWWSQPGNKGNNYYLTFWRPGYTASGIKGTTPDLTTSSGQVQATNGGTHVIQWSANTINITWDTMGGSKVAATKATYSEDGKVPMPNEQPVLLNKKFLGWFTEREGGELVTADTALPTEDATYYAQWGDPKTVTFNPNGGRARLGVWTVNDESGLAAVDLDQYQGIESALTIYEAGSGGKPAIIDFSQASGISKTGAAVGAGWWSAPAAHGNNYNIMISRAGYTACGAYKDGSEIDISQGVRLEQGCSYSPIWRPNRYTVAFDANGANGTMPDAMPVDYEQGDKLPGASAQGLAFRGWNTKSDGTGDPYQPGDACDTLTQTDGATVTLYAQWTPIVSADAPLDVTVSVDLLGIEDQVPASGYIESRSGGALKVAAIDFTPLDGATALFGSSTADVALEALAGEHATSADVSFLLDAKATETDAAKLAAFALPDGFGTRIPIGYRFAIPDDVLGSIDPARFEQQAPTPVCSVYYTVALAASSS